MIENIKNTTNSINTTTNVTVDWALIFYEGEDMAIEKICNNISSIGRSLFYCNRTASFSRRNLNSGTTTTTTITTTTTTTTTTNFGC